jgi:hypothetical protein
LEEFAFPFDELKGKCITGGLEGEFLGPFYESRGGRVEVFLVEDGDFVEGCAELGIDVGILVQESEGIQDQVFEAEDDCGEVLEEWEVVGDACFEVGLVEPFEELQLLAAFGSGAGFAEGCDVAFFTLGEGIDPFFQFFEGFHRTFVVYSRLRFWVNIAMHCKLMAFLVVVFGK